MKQIATEFKGVVGKSTITVGGFNIPLSAIDKAKHARVGGPVPSRRQEAVSQ